MSSEVDALEDALVVVSGVALVPLSESEETAVGLLSGRSVVSVLCVPLVVSDVGCGNTVSVTWLELSSGDGAEDCDECAEVTAAECDGSTTVVSANTSVVLGLTAALGALSIGGVTGLFSWPQALSTSSGANSTDRFGL